MKNHGTPGKDGRLIWLMVSALSVPLGAGCQPGPCAIETACSDNLAIFSSNAVPSRDAGTPGDTPRDAGTPGDTGTGPVVSCEQIPHDPTLGTLKIHNHFIAAESTPFPRGMTAITVVPRKAGFALYGIRRTDKSIYALGTWPKIAPGAKPLEVIVAPEDRSAAIFLSEFLVNDGRRLLAGYIKGGTQLDGKVLVYDLDDPARSAYLPAPGNEFAMGTANAGSLGQKAFFVESMGLEKEGSKNGEFAIRVLKTQTEPFEVVTLAILDPDWLASGAASTVTTSGIGVLGYFSGSDTQTHLRAVPPGVYAHALDTKRSFSLADATEIYQGDPKGLLVAGFGDGVAIHRGTLPENSNDVDTQDVLLIPLALGSGTQPKIKAGQAIALLVSTDPCTNVMSLVSMGPELLVGLSDKNGQRLVRIKAR